jgi:transposase-like protein
MAAKEHGYGGFEKGQRGGKYGGWQQGRPKSTSRPSSRSSSPRRRGQAKTGNWTNATLKQAMDAVTNQGMKVRAAARTFGIPPTSLRDHLYGKVVGRKRGSKTMLKEEEEEKLLKYLFKMQDLGHPLTS